MVEEVEIVSLPKMASHSLYDLESDIEIFHGYLHTCTKLKFNTFSISARCG